MKFLGLAVAIASGSCGSSSNPTSPPDGGNLRIMLTDAPSDEICQLVVFFDDIRVKPDGLPSVLLGDQFGEFDLLELQDGPPVLLGDFGVEQGLYQFIEMLLDESQSFVVEKIYGRELKARRALRGDAPHPSPGLIKMRRAAACRPLNAEEKLLFVRWIDLGATYLGPERPRGARR